MKKLTLWLVIAMLLVSASAVFADQHEYSYIEEWDGRGSDSERCGYYDENRDPAVGWIHWVFSTKGSSTDAMLFLMDKAGAPLGSFAPAEPLNANVWHFFTPYSDLTDLVAKIELYGGLPGKGGGLVISDYCLGEEEVLLDVDKTAYTSFKRTHDWDIDKKVETENEHMLDGYPKIWLYTDGKGDEKATWKIDVTYLGYKDTDHKVWGEITVENKGKVDAKIVDIQDWLVSWDGLTKIPVDVTCGGKELSEVLPYDLAMGEKLECEYSHMFDPDEAFEGYNYAVVTTDEEKEFFDDADIIWGDPDPELHAVVDIWDKSDLFGQVKLGTLDALNLMKDEVTTFKYDKDFAYVDYDECGPFRYDNTASVVDVDVVLDKDDATLKVNVQCIIFKGETAWAANGDVAGSLRYTTKGNWATYVKYWPKTTTLFAGQHIPVGKVTFSPIVSNKVTITVEMTEPWMFEKVSQNLKVQGYTTKPSGNPAPGKFKYKQTCDPDSLTCEITVPKAKYYGVHANVGWWMPDPNFGPK
jgi:hypothetical protein